MYPHGAATGITKVSTRTYMIAGTGKSKGEKEMQNTIWDSPKAATPHGCVQGGN